MYIGNTRAQQPFDRYNYATELKELVKITESKVEVVGMTTRAARILAVTAALLAPSVLGLVMGQAVPWLRPAETLPKPAAIYIPPSNAQPTLPPIPAVDYDMLLGDVNSSTPGIPSTSTPRTSPEREYSGHVPSVLPPILVPTFEAADKERPDIQGSSKDDPPDKDESSQNNPTNPKPRDYDGRSQVEKGRGSQEDRKPSSKERDDYPREEDRNYRPPDGRARDPDRDPVRERDKRPIEPDVRARDPGVRDPARERDLRPKDIDNYDRGRDPYRESDYRPEDYRPRDRPRDYDRDYETRRRDYDRDYRPRDSDYRPRDEGISSKESSRDPVAREPEIKLREDDPVDPPRDVPRSRDPDYDRRREYDRDSRPRDRYPTSRERDYDRPRDRDRDYDRPRTYDRDYDRPRSVDRPREYDDYDRSRPRDPPPRRSFEDERPIERDTRPIERDTRPKDYDNPRPRERETRPRDYDRPREREERRPREDRPPKDAPTDTSGRSLPRDYVPSKEPRPVLETKPSTTIEIIPDESIIRSDVTDYEYNSTTTRAPKEEREWETVNLQKTSETQEVTSTEAAVTTPSIYTNCICVPYYQCEEGEIITDGSGIIDSRQTPSLDKEVPLSGVGQATGSQKPPYCGKFHVCCKTPETYTVKPYEHRCGVRNPSGINSRILSSEVKGDADFGEWPWQVGTELSRPCVFQAAVLKVDGKVNVFQCGGTLIDQRHVITVAHCVVHYRYHVLCRSHGQPRLTRAIHG
ncbi:hypothetical protein LAZ67_3004409 [Cordylochernes scorpioides]|uniref:Serine proteinase stubble n=1 Tax=Cordylochernes scorpioides TaxID=51811 RepID=A0ABY6KCH5_9ARAC|nr:hypothetical protein LAZ67_3004409 [Cordylochernes scorpioides]